MREFFAENAACWIDEFHLAGLRLDTTQQIFDGSAENVQRLIIRTARAAACRPNQLIAISLDHPVLNPEKWPQVSQTVREKLLTPVGLRSPSRDHPDYKAKYFGDLRARDAANHQGTVWGWLIGPFIDAWLKVHPGDGVGARRWLEGFMSHLDEGGIRSVSEVFDAEPPYTPRGGIAQAWSVAELLRVWVKTAEPDREKDLNHGREWIAADGKRKRVRIG